MRIVVIGAGIAGLAAALRLHDTLGSAADVTVCEGASWLGGKLRTGEIGGRVVETGAETFLTRKPDDPAGGPSAAVRLAGRLGLAENLTTPATLSASVLRDGVFAPMPGGTLMGVPADLSVVDWAPVHDADIDRGGPVLGPEQDVTVGSLVRERMGDAVVDRMVDPLLGGVYAGRADDLSVTVTMPGLAAALRDEHTLQAAVRRTLAARVPGGAPFASVPGGLSGLVEAMVAAMPTVRIRTGCPVRAVRPDAGRWRLDVGATRDHETIEADAVVMAVPGRPSARLLAGVNEAAAEAMGTLDYASIGLVTYVLPPGSLDHTPLAGRSGALVPAVEGRMAKAITVFSTKWAPQPDGHVLMRASVGRYGDTAALGYDDQTLVKLVHEDLGGVAGSPLPAWTDARVFRWGGALPQYTPGHSVRIARARAALPPTVVLAGAAYDGVGIPACIASGERAADNLVETLGR